MGRELTKLELNQSKIQTGGLIAFLKIFDDTIPKLFKDFKC